MNSDTSTSCKCGLQTKLWWSRAEVGERFGVAVGTLAGWAVQGIGPKYVVIGKFARYHIDDLEQWENQLRNDYAPAEADPAEPPRQGHRRAAPVRAPSKHPGDTAA